MASEKSEKPIEILKWQNEDGAFKRRPSSFRDWISAAPGAKFAPELGRYHLYVSFACPWAHRVLIMRLLKGLGSIISVSVVHWHLDGAGWRFINDEEAKSVKSASDLSLGERDSVNHFDRLRQIYFAAEPDYAGRFTVPVLWDKKLNTIVNNESSEIIRMLNTEFNALLPEEYAKLDFYPANLKPEIDEVNEWIYDNINNGVYKSGFATKQEVYSAEVKKVFEHLDKVEEILADHSAKGHSYLVGNQLTEADIRLFTTIIRFDPVYVQHFKCNIGMIRYNYPHIHNWVRKLYWTIPGFKETTDFEHIKFHYTKSHVLINQFGITPEGPLPNILPLDA